MLTDEPVTPIMDLIRNFCDNYPAELIILTGREDTPEIRKATEQWLEDNWLHPDMLLMRPLRISLLVLHVRRSFMKTTSKVSIMSHSCLKTITSV